MKKFSFKSVLLLMATLILVSSCDDEFSPSEQNYFVGQWYQTFADDRIASDGSLTFVFAHYGICHVENYNALGDSEHPELSVIKEHGSWSYDEKDKTLTIETEYFNPMTKEPARFKRIYRLGKFAQNSFHATSPLSSHPQELIFKRETRDILQ